MAYVVYDNNDNIVTLSSVTNGMTAASVTGATVVLRLLNAGTAVSGATGISMVASTGAKSTYRGTLPYTLTLATGTTYTAEITVTSGALHGQWDVPVRCATRTS
jgi:hypothetical protein